MTIDTRGPWWRGTEASDLDAFLRDYTADTEPVDLVVHAACAGCRGTTFAAIVDDEHGYAERGCVACGARQRLADSDRSAGTATPALATCPCGQQAFEVAVGFALHDEGDVRWLYVAMRCVTDGILGVYADWEVGYRPSSHLPDVV